MNCKTMTLVCAGLVAISAQAMAADPGASSGAKMQQMKECMEHQKATNSSLTQSAMETVCRNQMKDQTKSGNDLASGPQAPHEGADNTKPAQN